MGTIRVIERRISDILSFVNEIQISLPYVSAKRLASLAEKINSLYPVIGSIAQLKSRFLHMEIERRVRWDKVYPLPRDSGVISELIFWKNDLIKLNNRLLFNYSSPQVLAFSDASALWFDEVSPELGK